MFRSALANDTFAIMGHATRKAVYLDCAATTPLDPRVRDEVLCYLDEEFGNAGSRTHEYGRRARTAIETARDRIASAVATSRGDVFFTSGATESNNLAILGLSDQGRRHVITSRIEHHAVLEPVAELQRRGFEITFLNPEPGGWIAPGAVHEALRPDTLLVSVMHVNNETGVLQPVGEIADALGDHPAYYHVDAAQGFGKDLAAIQHSRIDMISASGHKIHAPKGVGALILRRRNGERPPVKPLLFGGGQERDLRPGTLPVHLIAGFGKAAELAVLEWQSRDRCCRLFRERLLDGLAPLGPVIHGDIARSLPNIVNLSIPGVEAETAIEAWSDLVAISDGAACTSASYTCSHVLSAMRLPEEQMVCALRFSWCHSSEMPDLEAMVEAIRR
jgi:cysteine desulfurase